MHIFVCNCDIFGVVISIFLTGDQKSANIAEALLKKTFVVIYKFNVFTTKYSKICITFLDGVLFSTLERQVTEQFLYNKTMDQDTWFNDYKSIREAGYRFSPTLLFSFFAFDKKGGGISRPLWRKMLLTRQMTLFSSYKVDLCLLSFLFYNLLQVHQLGTTFRKLKSTKMASRKQKILRWYKSLIRSY